MKTSPLRRLASEVRRHGATIDRAGQQYGWLNIDAPSGMVWACTGDTHALAVTSDLSGVHPGPHDWTDAVNDAIERMNDGLVPCDDPNCEHCHSVEE